MLNIGETLKELRDAHGLSGNDLAQVIGLSVGTYLRIERGESDPSFATIFRICQFYGISMQDFVNRLDLLDSDYPKLSTLLAQRKPMQKTAKRKPMIYQIQIALKGSKPRIWRRVLVSSDLSLSDFHLVIQTAMGWTNSHLHQFIHRGIFYTERMIGDEDYWDEMDNVDYEGMEISDPLVKVKDKIIYEYDFGDGWEHALTLEEILPIENKEQVYPFCTAGKMHCPPEDCGGMHGYLSLLEILKQPDHEEYESYLVWLGGSFDPKEFDIDKTNERLQSDNYGVEEPDDFY